MRIITDIADIKNLPSNKWNSDDLDFFLTMGWDVKTADELCRDMARSAISNMFQIVRVPRFSSSKELLYVQVYERCPCKTYGKGEYDTFHFCLSWVQIRVHHLFEESPYGTILRLVDDTLREHVLQDQEKARQHDE